MKQRNENQYGLSRYKAFLDDYVTYCLHQSDVLDEQFYRHIDY